MRPWCPVQYRIHPAHQAGLESEDDVRRIALHAQYLVLGTGRPSILRTGRAPLDPRHRSLNPPSTIRANLDSRKNAVGIGGPICGILRHGTARGLPALRRTLQM